MTKISYTMEIVSITATYEIGVPINLNELAKKVREFNYKSDYFLTCGYLKDSNLKGKAQIWKSGTIHLIAKNKRDIAEDLDYILKKLEEKMNIKPNNGTKELRE